MAPYQSLAKALDGQFICGPYVLGSHKRKAMRWHHDLRMANDEAYLAQIERRKTEQYFKRNPLAVQA